MDRFRILIVAVLVAAAAAFLVVGLRAIHRSTRAAQPATEHPTVRAAIDLITTKQYDQAISALQPLYASTTNPVLKAKAALYLGRCHNALKRYSDAVPYWEVALRVPEFSKYATEADDAYVGHAQALAQAGEPLRARDLLKQYSGRSASPDRIQQALGDLNVTMLFSPLPTEEPPCTLYTVKEGDSLERIAKTFNTTVDLLKGANGIEDPRTLQIGRRLKVCTAKWRIVIRRSTNILSLFADDTLFKEYRVGTGEHDKTPLGEFTIKNKIPEPPWRNIPYGHPDNVLGTRWMGISDEAGTLAGYGIHGTWQPDTVGQSRSQGCIRLLNQDVEELYKIVTVGTPVRIIE